MTGMKISLCTISFRHHLVSFENIVRGASAMGFDGIEIWGAHARSLAEDRRDADWLAGFGLSVPMISDYLPLDRPGLDAHVMRLAQIARRWDADRIRTFAGRSATRDTGRAGRETIVAGLRHAVTRLAENGIDLLVETHPGTLADSLDATQRLLREVEHPGLGVNFDAIHLWAAGDDPVAAHRALGPHIRHHHLKNIAAHHDLGVFAPSNVYDAAGPREGMVPLFEGAYDYRRLIAHVADDPMASVALEWFGPDPWPVLAADRARLADVARRASLKYTPQAALRGLA